MNKMRLFQILAALLCIGFGLAIFFIHTDQQFIHLTPSDGSGLLVSISADNVFEQTFVVHGKTLSKIGAYLIPVNTKAKNSAGVIHISLIQQGEVVGMGEVPVFRIDGDSASLITLTSPVQTGEGETLTMRITASPDAGGLIALKKRMFDESFPNRDIAFFINGAQQEYPVGYSVFETVWPPLVRQIGGLFIMCGVILLFWNVSMRFKNATAVVVLFLAMALYAIPSFGTYPGFLPLVVIMGLIIWALFRVSGRTYLASLFGTFIFVCSTWLPLHLITGGVTEGMLSVRDALIDPNQISVSHGAGGYVGIFAALFAVVGLCIVLVLGIRKRYTVIQVDLCMAVLLFVSMFVAFVDSPIHHPKAIIVVVFSLAWFASLSFDKMQRFLGLQNTFIQTLMGIVLAITLLDLMHITARTFTYGIGI